MDLYGLIKEKFICGEFLSKSKKQIFSALGAFKEYEKKSIEKILLRLESEGVIIFWEGKYVDYKAVGLIKGELKGNERGYAFLISSENESGDIFIPNRRLHGAEHRDTVIVKKTDGANGRSEEGEVVKILKRGITSLCGTYYTEKHFGFVRPDDRNYFDDIFISFKHSLGAKSGDKVFVELKSFSETENPEGVVKEIIGRQYDLMAEENSVILSFGYPKDFTEEVKSEVENIPDEVEENQLIGRLNLTKEDIFTIDGDDSRDFDDAVGVTKLGNGNYKLGVHIADVSEYVKMRTALDDEAYNRSTSVYFPDRVIPMLPEKLSNGICSLNEGVVRLTLSCIMEIDGKGEVVDKKIVKSYIRSKHRLTYKKVQAMLDGDKAIIDLYEDIYPIIKDMYELKKILYAKRSKRGNIDLDVKEADITIVGNDISIEPRKSIDAYGIIEEFMIAANECVAEYAFYLDVPFVYRIHEKPNAEKAEMLKKYLSTLGISAKFKPSECYPTDFSRLLDKVRGSYLFSLVNKVMLRSMQKAKYSPDNKGHFGLSSKCYCHFTSPIRRYPDLVVHRIVKDLIDGKMGEIIDLYGDFVRSAADISSENERKADEAEREVDDVYKVKYMEKRIGEEYDAVISGVTQSGVFCELENTVEGFTSIKDLPRGQYKFDENTYSLFSSKYRYKLGDKVRVGVLGADVSSRKIDFIILSKKS